MFYVHTFYRTYVWFLRKFRTIVTPGPVASNHGNLKKHRYFPWFKGNHGVHAEVNGTKGKNGRMGTGMDTGTERAGQRGRNEEDNGD